MGEDEKPLMSGENVELEEETPQEKKTTCCCPDSVCIGIAWGVFIILLIVFIFAVILKYQKDG